MILFSQPPSLKNTPNNRTKRAVDSQRKVRESIFTEDFMLHRHLLPLGGILFKQATQLATS